MRGTRPTPIFASVVRTFIAVVLYLGGGVLHLVLIARGQLGLYRLFDDAALLDVYATAWSRFVEPALPWIVVPVILFEWTIGVLMLSRGRHAKTGHVAGAVWNVLLAPFGPWGWMNLALAAVHAWLARVDFQRPAWGPLVHRLDGGRDEAGGQAEGG